MGDRDELAELRARVAALEDERDLRALLARYAFTADLGRSRDWVALYTEDGAVDLGDTVASMSGGPPPPGYPERPRFVGHEDLLLKFITALPHRRVEGRSQHHTTGPIVFHLDGDTATAEGYSTLITRDGDGFRIEVANFNRWSFRRVEGVWKIVERMMRPIGSAEAATVFEATLP